MGAYRKMKRLQMNSLTEKGFELIVEDEYEGTTSSTQNVGEGSLEEGTATFRFVDLAPAVKGVLVHNFRLGATRLHHHTTTNSVEGIGDDTRNSGDTLGNHPVDDQWSVLGVGQHTTGSIVQTEVSSAVDDDTLNGDAEATVQTKDTIRFDGLGETVTQTTELAFGGTFTDIGSQTGTGKVQGVDEAKRGCSGSTTRCQVGQKPPAKLGLLVNSTHEHLFVDIFESKVQSLGGEITDDIGQVSSPESSGSLFLGDADESINNTFVLLVGGDLFRGMLHLEEQFDTFDGSYGCFGNSGRHTTGDEIFSEGKRIVFEPLILQ